jgi:glycerol-3-phosphate O-acyltransferase
MKPASASRRVVDIGHPALLQDENFCSELETLAGTLGISIETAREEAEHCISELAITPRDRYLNWSARLARFIYSRSYDAHLDVDEQALEHLQSLAAERPLVLLWSHKSHLDSFVFLRAFYDGNFRPQPLSFAGINMSFAGFGTLARNAGAIFLRRSFKGADVYKLVFRHYIRYLVANRAPLSWSIEGTRSRTGKLMPPRPGLLQWVLEALAANGDESALFVPVSITFDQIAEMDDYIAINRGEAKRKESLGWFLKYIFGMQKSAGKIYLRFGTPVSLQDQGEIPEKLLQSGDGAEHSRTLRLALEVSHRIEHNTLVTPHSLVCVALLTSEGSPTPLGQLQHRLGRLQHEAERADLPRVAGLDKALGTGLPELLGSLVSGGLLHSGDGGWFINPAKALGASYYRNTVSHFFLYSALGELALAHLSHTDSDPGYRKSIGDKVQRWRELLKFEFVFYDREKSVHLALAHIDRSYPNWEQQLANGLSPFGELEPIFARGILVSNLEAYRLYADSILEAHTSRTILDPARHALDYALENPASLQSAVSLPLMENARKLCANQALSEGAGLAALRDELAGVLNRAMG